MTRIEIQTQDGTCPSFVSRVDHQIVTYPAKHGWVFRDTPVFNETSAERHWQTLVALLESTLMA